MTNPGRCPGAGLRGMGSRDEPAWASPEGDQTPTGSCLHSELMQAKWQGKPPVSWRCSFWEQGIEGCGTTCKDWRMWCFTRCLIWVVILWQNINRKDDRKGRKKQPLYYFQEVIYFYIMDPFLSIMVCSDCSASSLKLDVHCSLLSVVQLLSRVDSTAPWTAAPAFPALHHLSELAQSHVRWVGWCHHVRTCVILRWIPGSSASTPEPSS